MSEVVTTKKLLEFLVKACKVSPSVTFKKTKNGEYEINIYCDWDRNNDFYIAKTFISEDGYSTWETDDFDFFTLNYTLDQLVKQQEIDKQREQKREELLSRLTDEEKEILGV